MIIITGVSRGVGKATAELFLEKGEDVIGIGRRNSIQHPNYQFHELDLQNPSEIDGLDLEVPEEKVTLINNAGIIGNIKRITDQDNWDLPQVLDVNVVAPMLLAKKIYQGIEQKSNFRLVNISSGAANRAIPSWAAYCASKAALNMLSQSFYVEEREKGNHVEVYAVSPGIIDTDMQKKIRASKSEDFSSVEKFINMKENNELYSPEECARRLYGLLENKYLGEILCDLRNIEQ
jgi:benzil reductase ((S)-benzoin forming)